MPTHTIELSDHDDAWLRSAVESGDYPSISAAIEDALGLLEAEDQMSDDDKLKRLQKIAREGFEGAEGPDAIVLDTEEDLKAYMDGILREVLDRGKARRVETAA